MPSFKNNLDNFFEFFAIIFKQIISHLKKLGSGMELRDFLIRKRPGVDTWKLSSSVNKGQSSRKFKILLICIPTIRIFFSIRWAAPTVLFRWYLKALTPAPQRPPKLGALGGENFQLMPYEDKRLKISSLFRNSAE